MSTSVVKSLEAISQLFFPLRLTFIKKLGAVQMRSFLAVAFAVGE